ncbi:FAD FMN-containing dehydrogenase [Lecanosticta acicola]|uniref:FAD FMN-containing dehydrogenase n=1 Tax=Lecanosticta acicola TaxID=111012 RepID=A0AAI8YVK8_9PEZI|nr:FAD FMN-containing dehydrogenase [Lecanosticta acicola]
MASTTASPLPLRSLLAFLFLFVRVAVVAGDNDHDAAVQLVPRQDLHALKDCLAKAGARAIYPDSDADAGADGSAGSAGDGGGNGSPAAGFPRSQNTNYHYTPAVVVQPTSAQEVAAVVQAVAQCAGAGFRLSSFGGGHGYASYALGGHDGYVIIDSSGMKKIHLDPVKKIVTADMGVRIGPLAQEIGKKGFGLPHGTCPSVGLAGHSLSGGWGFSSRKWGWLMDHVVSLVYVDAEGKIKEVSQASKGPDAEIWWAMRGAGANNFGVVTSFALSVVDAPAKAVNYKTIFKTNDDCAAALLSLQELGSKAASLPPELGAQLLIYGEGSPGDPGAGSFSGQYLGPQSQFQPVQQRMLQSLKAHGVNTQAADWNVTEKTGWVETLTDLMGNLDAPPDVVPYYAQSLMDDGSPGYTQESAQRIVKAIQATVKVEDTSTSLSFDLNGPGAATNSPDPYGDSSLGAAGHRKALFLSQLYNYGTPGFDKPQAQKRVFDAMDGVSSAVRAAKPGARWGSYVNYIDPRLQDFGRAYYGPGLERLKSIKKQVDPKTIFDFPQGLAHA